MARKVYGYLRVSTLEQEQGFGLQAQEHQILEFAREKDLGSVTLYRESRSGEHLDRRLELLQLLDDAETRAEAGDEVVIVFPGLDRLSRQLIDQEGVVLRCFDRGIQLRSTHPSEDETLSPDAAGDPMRTAIRQFWGLVHQLEHAIIKRRLSAGHARKAAGGGFTGGRAPFGYRSVNRELEVDPERAPIVRRLFALRNTGLTQTSIASILRRNYPDACGGWGAQQVGRILKNEKLYREGRFRPRGSSDAHDRPDLRILDGNEDLEGLALRSEGEKIPWGSIPTPVRLDGLALLLGISERELAAAATAGDWVIRQSRGHCLVPEGTSPGSATGSRRGKKRKNQRNRRRRPPGTPSDFVLDF